MLGLVEDSNGKSQKGTWRQDDVRTTGMGTKHELKQMYMSSK
jgi:hypothetical protein